MKKYIIYLLSIILTTSCGNKSQTIDNQNNKLKIDTTTQERSSNSLLSFRLDTSVSQICLDNRDSYYNAFKDPDNYLVSNEDSTHKFPYIEFYNAGLTEKMTTYFHHGNPKYYVSEFVIEPQKGKKGSYELIMLNHFKTTNGIKLGSNSKEVAEKIGIPISINKIQGTEIWSYGIYGNYDFLKRYNRYKFYARYTIKNDKVNKIEFGFEYE